MDVFDDWNDRFPRGEDADHRVGPLTEDSVFLFQSVTAPLPSGAHWGSWSWYENSLQLRAHLLYVALPDMAATWLNEGAVGLNADRQPLAATIAGAADGWGEDKHFFEELAHDLETSAGATNRDLATEMQQLARQLTERFGRTRTWDLRMQVFPSVTDAGAFLFDKDPEAITDVAGNPISRSEWLLLCERAAVDRDAGRQVEDTFADAFEL
ncbi:MAG TPA: hypothetical protein DCQ04_12565 [Actinobacteria bacterium]|nr:hypothetical protein [Actinomycetota bacterium]